jgi:hypothetical protein
MQRIDQILVRRFRGTPLQPVIDVACLHRDWPRVAGEPWGSVSAPFRLRDGVLYLTLPDASWAQRLAYEGRGLARKVEAYLGRPVTLRHRVSQRAEPPPARPPLAPLVGDPRVLAAVAGVEDPRLREALTSFFGHVAATWEPNQPVQETK